MDTKMKNQSLDDLIAMDKKKGRHSQRGGRSRGGNRGGAQAAQNVKRIKNKGTGIYKNKNRGDGGQNQQRSQNQNANRGGRGGRPVAASQGNQQANRGNSAQANRQANQNSDRRTQVRKQLADIRRNQKSQGGNRPQQQSTAGSSGKKALSAGNSQKKAQNRTEKTQQQQRRPVAPQQARKGTGPNGQQRQVAGKTLALVQGTLAQRKIKVHNIDAKTVTNQDLNKLFSKCGPMIQARFDTNEFGQFLGTATIIYARAIAASKAIKEYNGASLDNRVMKVMYADAGQSSVGQNAVGRQNHTQRPRLQREERRQKATQVRRTAGRIQKNREEDRAASSSGAGSAKPRRRNSSAAGRERLQNRRDQRRAIRARANAVRK